MYCKSLLFFTKKAKHNKLMFIFFHSTFNAASHILVWITGYTYTVILSKKFIPFSNLCVFFYIMTFFWAFLGIFGYFLAFLGIFGHSCCLLQSYMLSKMCWYLLEVIIRPSWVILLCSYKYFLQYCYLQQNFVIFATFGSILKKKLGTKLDILKIHITNYKIQS